MALSTNCINQVYRQGLQFQNLVMVIRSTLKGLRILLSSVTNRTGLLHGLHRDPRIMPNIRIQLESPMGFHVASHAGFHHPLIRKTTFH